jgi:hypothetical protein
MAVTEPDNALRESLTSFAKPGENGTARAMSLIVICNQTAASWIVVMATTTSLH